MKTRIVILCMFIAVIVSSCLVKSLHPFFKEKDVVFKKELIGTWLDQDSDKWTICQNKTKPGFLGSNRVDSLLNHYTVSMTDKDGTSKFIAHLFKLNNQLYVDFFPEDINITDLTAFHLVQAHSIAKIEIYTDSIKIKWFNELWLADLFKNNKIRLSHETISDSDKDESYVLTASTDELQKFIIKYGDDPNAFIDKSDEDPNKREEILCYTLKRVK